MPAKDMTVILRRIAYSVRSVQTLRNPEPINPFSAILLILPVIFMMGCTALPEQGPEPVIPLFRGYPLPADSLRAAGSLIRKGDGEGLFRLAAENDAALKNRLDLEAASLRPMFCHLCDEDCRRRRIQVMADLTEKRNAAHRKQLKLRLDALESRMEMHFASQKGGSEMSEFRRNRLLLETVADERLLLIQKYWLHSLSACERQNRPEDHLFLPYYTAYFKLVKSLPAYVAAEFFP
jgi:hypothetical protein